MKLQALAIVRLPLLGQVRPAALLWPREGGLVWVEPLYLDPNATTQRADHSVDGQLVDVPDGFDVVDGHLVVAKVRTIDAAEDDQEGSCARALADYTDQLLDRGVAIDDERERVAQELGLA